METQKPGDFLRDQIVNISKAGAYDAIKDDYAKVTKENVILKAAINKALDEITKCPPSVFVDNPAEMVRRVGEHLLTALKQTK
jgi:hypothetical protein